TPVIQDALEKAGPRLDAAGHRLSEDYLPRLSDKVGDVASQASDTLASVSTPKRAEKTLSAAAGKKRKKKSRKGVWIWLAVFAGAATAAAIVWKKSQPIDDPWSTPIDSRPDDARPVGSASRVAQQAAEKAKHTAEDVGNAAKSAANDASERLR